ncbi:FAD-dependent oxidoreductase [Bacillus pacificus]
MKSNDVPVLIVGGGLSGLASALFLAKHNIKYLLIERHPSTAIHPKAGGITFHYDGVISRIRFRTKN